MPRTTRAAAAALALITTAAGLVACGDDRSGDPDTIRVWSLEDVADRVTATRAIIADFTAATGVNVDLVTVNEDQFPSLVASAAAAGDLPDVIGSVSLSGVQTLAVNELLHPSANDEVVRAPAPAPSPRALELTSGDQGQLAVPSDGWVSCWSTARTSSPKPAARPDSYEAIAAAAAKLHKPNLAGITAATSPSVFTQQTFEHLALGNNCQLTDDAGQVVLDSPQCAEASASTTT